MIPKFAKQIERVSPLQEDVECMSTISFLLMSNMRSDVVVVGIIFLRHWFGRRISGRRSSGDEPGTTASPRSAMTTVYPAFLLINTIITILNTPQQTPP